MSQDVEQEVKDTPTQDADTEIPVTDAPEETGSAQADDAEAPQNSSEEAETASEAGAQSDAEGASAESEENSEASEAAGDEEKEKTGFFSKKKKKDKKDQQIEELTDKVRRTMAEFENFRKRNEREKNHMYEVGARDVIEKFLPVADSLERGLASIPEEEKKGAVAEGMEMIYRQLLTAFEQIGVKEIEAKGKEFDPNFHNAVMQEESEDVDENIIIEEFQKGYTYKDTVIRYSMVKVAK